MEGLNSIMKKVTCEGKFRGFELAEEISLIFFSLRTTQSYWEKDVSQIFGVLKRFLGALNLCRALG